MAAIFDIAFLGTSLVGGTGNNGAGGLPYGSICPDLTKAFVGKKSHLRVYNFGSGGSTSAGGIANFLPNALAVKPRALLVEFLINDCLGPTLGGFSVADCTANHQTIINAAKALADPPAIYLVTMNPTAGTSFSASARSNLPTYNAIYSSLAASAGIGFIDAYTGWGAGNLTDIPDGVHPTLAANISKLIPQIVTTLNPIVV